MRTFSLFLSILFISTISFAQWTSVNPHPSPNTSYIGSAPSANSFITVTGQGEAILTHDGGQTWDVVQIGGNGIYRSAFFLNNNLGWAAGSFVERLHKTTDGGYTWTHLPNAPDTTKYDVFFISENVGWCVGFNGFIIKTTDGGNTWFSQTNTSLTTQTLYSVTATDLNNVYVAGNANTLLKSTDGGNSWSAYPQIFTSSTGYRRVYFPPTGTGLTGYVVGNYNRIAKTVDGGVTWNPVNTTAASTQLWELAFNGSDIGLASGASSTVHRSTDGGNSWSVVTGFPTGITFYSVRFGSATTAYLSGSNGYIYKSTDAGANWFPVSYRFTSASLNDVCFPDSMNGYVVGTNFIARSTDGGSTFNIQTSPYSGDINEISAPSAEIAIAAGDAGVILYTTNGGAVWNQTTAGFTEDILAIDFIDNNNGWVAGYNGSVAKSTDGGATWTVISTIVGTSPWDMDMVDNLYGWVSGTGERIFGTTDGGITWNQQHAVGGLGTYGISFIDRFRGVAGGTGGNTYYTTDGGITWNWAITPPAQTVWGIHFSESPVGTFAMTACASGYVYLSTDGGMNWALEPRATINTFDDVWMSDAGHAWFAGNSGTIIKYHEPANVPVELTSFTAAVDLNNVSLTWITSTETNNSGFEIERAALTAVEETGGTDYQRIAFVKGNGTSTKPNIYNYTDNNLSAGTYNYRLKQIDMNGSFTYYELKGEVEIGNPDEYMLLQNYPNPFNPITKITFQIPANEFTSLKVYDVLGREAAVLVNEEKAAGRYEVDFNASNLSSGVYYYTIKAGNFTSTKKMIVVK